MPSDGRCWNFACSAWYSLDCAWLLMETLPNLGYGRRVWTLPAPAGMLIGSACCWLLPLVPT